MYIYFVSCILLASCTFEPWEPFQSCLQEMYTSKVSTTKDKAMGKLLFTKKFNLTEEEFKQGLLDEEFYAVEGPDGKTKYSWNVSEHAVSHGSKTAQKLEKSKELTDQQAKVEDAAFSCWSFGLLQPVSQYCHDWMHALCSQGVMQVAIFRLLGTLSAWTRMESYFKLWQLPASMKKAGNLHSLFTVKRVASHREAEKFKCTASECLGVCPILAYMVSSVFLSEESHMPMCNAFLAMVGVLELLQAVPSGKVTPAILQQQVERALHLCRDADGAGKFIRKHHWMLHFSIMLGFGEEA